VKRLGIFELERVDAQSLGPLRFGRRTVELDQHAVEAAKLAHAELLEQPVSAVIAREREDVQLRHRELARTLLRLRDEPRTEPASLRVRVDEAVQLERVAVHERDRVGLNRVAVLQHPRVLLEVHHAPPPEQL
jgi:hypothetical protein